MGKADFNRVIGQRNQLVVAIREFSTEEKLAGVHVKIPAKYMDEQPKLTHKVVEVFDQPQRQFSVKMLRYNVEKPETSYVQKRLFRRK